MTEQGPEDALLIRQALSGRTEAFGTLVSRYQERVFNVVLRVVGNRDDAQEVTQEAFLKAWKNLASFRGNSQFYTWMYRIAFNTAVSRTRTGGRVLVMPVGSSRGDDDDGPGLAEPAAPAEDPAAPIHRGEIRERIAKALLQVPEDLRQAVVLRDLEGLSYEEIAQVLDVAEGTVKSRIHRARAILRPLLEDLK